MNDEQKRMWDSYDILRKAATERFFERRKIESRLLMAFWAAIAALIVLILRQEVKEWDSIYKWMSIVLAFLSLLMWGRWTAGINRANSHDQSVARFFETKMMEVTKLEFPHEVSSEERFFGKPRRFLTIWSYQLHLAITALLLVALVLVVWTKKPKQALEPTSTAVTPAADAGTRASGTPGSP
jgi:hypothetical protein